MRAWMSPKNVGLCGWKTHQEKKPKMDFPHFVSACGEIRKRSGTATAWISTRIIYSHLATCVKPDVYEWMELTLCQVLPMVQSSKHWSSDLFAKIQICEAVSWNILALPNFICQKPIIWQMFPSLICYTLHIHEVSSVKSEFNIAII